MGISSLALFWAHKVVTAGILAVGVFLNLSALFFGMDLVAATFFNFTGELVLTTWFFLAFLLGVAVEVGHTVGSRTVRIIRRVVTVYMLMLTLAHGVNNLLLDNAEAYAAIFSGPLYNYTAIAVLSGLCIFVAVLPTPRLLRATGH